MISYSLKNQSATKDVNSGQIEATMSVSNSLHPVSLAEAWACYIAPMNILTQLDKAPRLLLWIVIIPPYRQSISYYPQSSVVTNSNILNIICMFISVLDLLQNSLYTLILSSAPFITLQDYLDSIGMLTILHYSYCNYE